MTKKDEMQATVMDVAEAAMQVQKSMYDTREKFGLCGLNTIAFLHEVMRPIAPLAEGLVLGMRGVSKIVTWYGERAVDISRAVAAATANLSAERDAAGEPTVREADDAMLAALIAKGVIPARGTPPSSSAVN